MRIRIKRSNEPFFDVKTLEQGHNKLTYRNIPLRKCPFDYVIYQMILFELKPDLIIEIGTDKGGSALYLADLLDIQGQGILHTIDIKNELSEEVKNHKRIIHFTDGWQNYNLSQVKDFNKILIIEDSSHFYQDTLDILNKFSDVVTTGSYFIIEDGIINKLGWEKQFFGGPLKAIDEFLSHNRNYQIDRKWTNLFGTNATFNVNGYLKKVS